MIMAIIIHHINNDNKTLILTLNDYLDTFNDNTNNNKTSTSSARLNDNTVT